MLRLTTFGGLALSRDGTPLSGAAAQRSRLSLLALLATAGPTGFSRDKLLLHLWPESDEERARHALKQAVYSLRRELGADDVIVGTASLTLNPLIISSDARDFEAAIAAGDNAAAAALYTGPFLDGVHLKDSIEFERWSGEQRARYAHMWTSAVERLAASCEARGAWREAAGHWRTLASSEPLSGQLTLALVRCLAESGDLGAALQQYKIHEALLREELGTTPEPAVASFAEALRAGTWTRSPDRPVVAAAPRPSAVNEARPADPPAEFPGGSTAARPSPAPRIGVTPARKKRRRSTFLAFVLGGLVVLVVGLTVSYYAMDPGKRELMKAYRGRSAATLVPRRIVVVPFENRTGDSTLDPLGEQIAEWFARELTEADFSVVDSRTALIGSKIAGGMPKFLRAHDVAVQVGEDTRSAYAVVGSIYRDGDSLEASVNIIDVATRQTQKPLGPFSGSREKAPAFIVRLLRPTIAYLGAEVDTSAGALMAKSTSPPSLEAFERVSRAWEHFFSSPRDTATVFAALDTAARLDTTYATPLMMKAYILDVKSVWPGVSDAMRRLRTRTARMSKLEKATMELLESDLRGNVLSRYAIAHRMNELSPASAEMPLLMVVSALYTGQAKTAVAALAGTDPNRGMNLVAPQYWEWGALAEHHAGNYAAEGKLAKTGLDRFRHHPPATYAMVRVLAARNDKELRKLVDRGVPPAKDPNDTPRDSVGDRQDLLIYAGRELRAHGFEAANGYFTDAAKELATIPPTATMAQRLRQAHAFYEARDYQRAKTAFAAIVAADTMDIESEGRLATSAVHLGDGPTARRIDAHLAKVNRPFLMGKALRWRASIAAAEGRATDAFGLLEMAVRQGNRLMDTPINLTIHLDQDFVPLLKLPAYAAMLQSLADAQTK